MPKLIIILSGKRKSGKSFLTEALTDYFGGDNCCVDTSCTSEKAVRRNTWIRLQPTS